MRDSGDVALQLLQHGDLDGAQSMFDYALQLRVAAFGEDHPSIATELANFGNVLAERALDIQVDNFGAEHPHTALALANLASGVRQQGCTEQAHGLLERAERIFRRRVGEQHTATRAVRNALDRMRNP